ncbi:MAG: hypothetical protein L0L93_12880 [Brevibacterium sp.]|nr:hypothetical protein [Brevibacterium sp.]
MLALFSTVQPADLIMSSGSGPAKNLSGFSGWAVTLMEALGPLGVGFSVCMDTIFPPILSEMVLPLAGFTNRQAYKCRK